MTVFGASAETGGKARLHSLLPVGGGLLVGVDLVKDKAVLEAAYNDAAGVTAAFVYPYIGFMPVFVTQNLHGGAREQGLILSAAGVGSISAKVS